MRIAIVTPAEIMPNKIPGLECECQNRPVDLALEPAFITWIKKTGEEVKRFSVAGICVTLFAMFLPLRS